MTLWLILRLTKARPLPFKSRTSNSSKKSQGAIQRKFAKTTTKDRLSNSKVRLRRRANGQVLWGSTARMGTWVKRKRTTTPRTWLRMRRVCRKCFWATRRSSRRRLPCCTGRSTSLAKTPISTTGSGPPPLATSGWGTCRSSTNTPEAYLTRVDSDTKTVLTSNKSTKIVTTKWCITIAVQLKGSKTHFQTSQKGQGVTTQVTSKSLSFKTMKICKTMEVVWIPGSTRQLMTSIPVKSMQMHNSLKSVIYKAFQSNLWGKFRYPLKTKKQSFHPSGYQTTSEQKTKTWQARPLIKISNLNSSSTSRESQTPVKFITSNKLTARMMCC